MATPDLLLLEEGYHVDKFHTHGDLKDILYGGPYMIKGQPMILKQWSPEFDFRDEFLTEIPSWITLPKLPMSWRGQKALSKMESAAGKPLFADEHTPKQMRISLQEFWWRRMSLKSF